MIEASSSSGTERSYPPSIGTLPFRGAAQRWIRRRFDIEVEPTQIGATIGSKEFVATLPQWMQLRTPLRDTVLYPAVSYPSYEMGASPAGCRPVPVRALSDGRMDLDSIDPSDVERALLLWVNSPGNPTGALDDLDAAACWGWSHQVPVFSYERHVEFHLVGAWANHPRVGPRRRCRCPFALEAVESRRRTRRVLRRRRRPGVVPPGGAQARRNDGARTGAGRGDRGARRRRARRGATLADRARLDLLAGVLSQWSGESVPSPQGAFYLWIPVDDGWEYTERLAHDGGALVSPGEFYGADGARFVRVAVVQPDERIQLVADRLAAAAR